MATRKAAWLKLLDGGQYRIPDNYSGLLRSLGNFSADVNIHIIFDPKNKHRMDFKFVRDGGEILTVRGHEHSAFTSSENTLYFAKYQRDSTGCTVMAYDLASGKQLWQTELHQSQPKGHSGYRNFASIRISSEGEARGEKKGAAIVITGKESYVDYVEVLDRQTGDSLAIKEYRVGFGSLPAGKP